MAQFERPDSDVTVDAWDTAPLWSKIDEVTPSDADSISTGGFSPYTNICEVGLSNVTDPGSSSGHIMRIRARALKLGATTTLTLRLYEGATQRASHVITSAELTSSFQTFTDTLTTAEADSIAGQPGYNNLRYRIQGTASGGIGESLIEVSWAEFEVPDAPTEQSKTYTLDTFLQKEKSRTYTADALLQKGKSRTFTADALLQKQKPVSYSADVVLQTGVPKSYSADLILRLGFHTVFLDDAVFSDWGAAKWDTDDYRWDAPEGPTKDSVIWARFQDDSMALTDAIEYAKEILRAYVVDTLLQAVNRQATYGLDTLIQQVGIQQAYSIDAFLKELDQARAYTSDALLKALSRQKTYGADAVIKRLDNARTYALDALLTGAGQMNYAVDVLLGRVFEAFLTDNVFSNWEAGEWDRETYWGSEGPGSDTSIQLAVLTDAMALTDAILPEMELVIERLLADGMALSDAVVQAFIQFAFLTDEVFTSWDSQNSLWDDPTEHTRWAGEGPAKASAVFLRKFDDAQTVSDDIETQKTLSRFLSDSVAVSDLFNAFLGAAAPPGSIVRIRVDGTAQLVDLFPVSIMPTGATRYNEIKISGGGVIPQLSGRELGGVAVEAIFIGTEAGKDQLMADIAALLGQPLKVEFLLHREYREGVRALLVTFSSRLAKDGVYRIDLIFRKR